MAKTAPSTDNYILGKGKLYAARIVAGVNTGEIDFGNTPAFTVSPTIESLDHFESMDGIKEKDKSVDVSIGYTGKFTLDEYSRENLMLFLMGTTESDTTQATGHQVNDPITARLDRWVKLTFRNVAILSVTNVAGTTHYVENTDYTVDTAVGRIKAITGGSITDAQVLHIDYTYDASEYPTLSALQTSSIECFIRFVGAPDVGPKYEMEIWRAKIKPTGDLPFISDEWGQMEFEFEVLKDHAGHPTDPWFKLYDMTVNEATAS